MADKMPKHQRQGCLRLLVECHLPEKEPMPKSTKSGSKTKCRKEIEGLAKSMTSFSVRPSSRRTSNAAVATLPEVACAGSPMASKQNQKGFAKSWVNVPTNLLEKGIPTHFYLHDVL